MSERKEKVLLINCPFGDLASPYLGLASIASHLNHHGVDARILDLNLALYEKLRDPDLWDRRFLYTETEAFQQSYARFKSLVDAYLDWMQTLGVTVFGFTVHAYNLLFVNEVARALDRAKDNRIVMGGPSIRLPGERRLIHTSDRVCMVRGRGEPVMLPLLEDLRAGRAKPLYDDADYPPIEDDGAITTFDEFELDRYLGRTLPLLFNYGCSRRCAYCNEPRFTNGVITKPIDRMINEIFYYKEKVGHNFFEFVDLALNVRAAAFRELCEAMVRRRTDIVWTANAIPSSWFTRGHCELVREAGCDFLRFGVESGSESVVRRMRKPFGLAQVRQALRNCNEAGIKTGINLIVGFPGEGESEFAQTLDFLRENRSLIHRVDNIFTCYVSGESDLERHPDRYGITLPDQRQWYQWATTDGGNTFEIRKRRHERLLDFLEQEGIRHGTPDFELNRHIIQF